MTAVRAVKAGESLSEITAPVEFFNDLDGLWEGISSHFRLNGPITPFRFRHSSIDRSLLFDVAPTFGLPCSSLFAHGCLHFVPAPLRTFSAHPITAVNGPGDGGEGACEILKKTDPKPACLCARR